MTWTTRARMPFVSAALVALAIAVGAQERRSTDPRVGLKPGFRNAGVAARNMELVASLPKPDGFFDPKAPAGTPTPPETAPPAPATGSPQANPSEPPPEPPAPRTYLNFLNSDLAFSGHHAFLGSFHGFNAYDIENAKKPHLATSVV